MAAAASIVTCPSCGTRNRVPQAKRGRVRCASCHADLPWFVEADDATFHAAVVESTLPVLVDVWAPWCGPCRMVSPVVEQFSRDFAGRLKVVKVNSDTSPRVSRAHGIQSIPTLLLYEGGREVSRQVGALPAAQLRGWVDAALPA
ncbi:thiol reductase thioredoxin [Agromyces rhizosphaerae]|uniref:Thioredoxin n=1 Tax=Agromyces rhizosphaerae TaxID=88374 RepID=A0A9W6CU70_9MICO|nr:thioredoxin [Agromyces rhizosphaerae]GLI29126.1 thiol reductase thioredoxin [Agromyces rhizosphaerae]